MENMQESARLQSTATQQGTTHKIDAEKIFNFSGGIPQSRLGILYLRSAKQHNAPCCNSGRKLGIFTVSAVFLAQLPTPDFVLLDSATSRPTAGDNPTGIHN